MLLTNIVDSIPYGFELELSVMLISTGRHEAKVVECLLVLLPSHFVAAPEGNASIH